MNKLEKMEQERLRLNAAIKAARRHEKRHARVVLQAAQHALGVTLAKRHGATTPQAVEALADRLALVPHEAPEQASAGLVAVVNEDSRVSKPVNRGEHRSAW